MKTFVLAVAAVLFVGPLGGQRVQAGDGLGHKGPFVRTATVNTRGDVVPAVTRLHPVIGSVQRTGHFTNPFTHKSKYTGVVYNPLNGSFGTQKFRR